MTVPSSYTPDEARQLLESELSDPQYQRQLTGPVREAIDGFLRWLDARFSEATGLNIPFGAVVVLLLVAAAVIAVILLVRPRLQRAPSTGAEVRIRAGMSAEQLRAQAAEHDARGSHAEAFRDTYRAMARSAEERQLLDAQTGRTATEIALALGDLFGDQESRLREAAENFSRSVYGRGELTRGDYEQLQQLDQQLTAAAPTGSSAERRPVAPQ
ncbi:DUF4129 domain-containing protein [Nesterenkonia populi]|uniref:DUF4129 domain-containing protein n=1 Tax=Nesterenkonia populi TaxID=1591087 RepID=UPI001478717B|nr:DUF4129 domain-containing protein [Nesterenkonia populi]